MRKLPKFLAGSLVLLVFVSSTTPIDTASNFISSLSDFERLDLSVNVAGLLGTTIHRQETPYSQVQVVDSGTCPLQELSTVIRSPKHGPYL
ncbi:MAG TPA: hypothetical protein VNI77_03060 [Nitrososphaera sp.]|nr:hypothetical protein [Nitrososphaera sp.]